MDVVALAKGHWNQQEVFNMKHSPPVHAMFYKAFRGAAVLFFEASLNSLLLKVSAVQTQLMK